MPLKSKVTDFLETINCKGAGRKPALLKAETRTWALLPTFLPLADPTHNGNLTLGIEDQRNPSPLH